MSIIREFYQNKYAISDNYEYCLSSITNNMMIGKDDSGYPSIVICSEEEQRDSLRQTTAKISLECNIDITYLSDGELINNRVHIIKCLSNNKEEIDIFLRLCDTYLMNSKNTIDYICHVFNTLNSLFFKKKNYSATALQGLYTELYTMYYFKNDINLAKFWQSKDKMKFDFSINSKVKLEIKSTKSEERKHHFKHEQLAIQLYDIYILSYKLREDDRGLNLWDLINKCMPILADFRDKQGRLLKVILDVGMDELQRISYSEDYLINNMKLYKADEIPKFDVPSPEGVINAEYDCICDSVEPLDIRNTINELC